MSKTSSEKATFGRRASLISGDKLTPKTQIVVTKDGISIRVSHISASKITGHTRVDFQSKRKKD